ncbi:MAG: DUF1501 domain-containing protein [Planctomycetes bacterium]|nr:DUF1501 domain-containing protein [Planctomycetota bacterium]
MPRFLVRAALAAGGQPAAKSGERVLVVVQLQGGNDGLNTVVPFAMDDYYRRRPSIAIARADVRKLDDVVGLHPEMSGMESLFKDGRLAIVQGVGYPDPDRSHFRSTEIWESADLAGGASRSGWLGRCLCDRSGHGESLLPGVALGGREMPQALVADRPQPTRNDAAGDESASSAVAVESLDEFRVRGEGLSPEKAALERKLLADLAGEPRIDTEGSLEFVRQSLSSTFAAAERLHDAVSRYSSPVNYPDFDLARKLRQVAQVHLAGFGTRIFFVTLGGFDTHASQRQTQALLLRELSQSLAAFVADLRHHGALDQVLVMTFSEFGRRVEENGSAGTDHGTAAPLFIAGGGVKGGLVGAHPRLDDLVDGDVKFAVDFRRVYATAIESWLGVPSASVLGAPFDPLPIV